MPVVGFKSSNGASDQPEGKSHCSFEYALKLAESGDSEAFPFPYPVLKGIVDANQDRGDYISATSILHCLRAQFLRRKENSYLTPDEMYPAFRGTLFHALMEQHKNPNSRIEEKTIRKYRGIEIGGTFDSLVLAKDEDGKDVLQDWKTTKNLPKYESPYSSHIAQVNIYRWLLGLDPTKVILEVWYFNMEGMKRCRLKDGTQPGRGGKTPTNQHWSDEQVEKFLDDRLVKLKASMSADIPMPLSRVPEEDKWECAYCPIKPRCDELAWLEQKAAWRKEYGLPPEPDSKGNGGPFWDELLEGFVFRMNVAFPKSEVGLGKALGFTTNSVRNTAIKELAGELAIGPKEVPLNERPLTAVPKPEPKKKPSRYTRKAA